MKKINDESYIAMRKEKKYKELWDFETVEVRVASFSAIMLLVVSLVYVYFNGSDEYTNMINDIFGNIGIALIGFLGFVVTGLAILTGSISGKVVNYMKKRDVYDCLYSILLSFYFIGFLIALQIVVIFFMNIISNMNIGSICFVSITITVIISYLFVFTLFYSVGLIGNCVSVFSIVSDIDNNLCEEEENEKRIYDSYRIIALEHIILKSGNMEEYEQYKSKVDELIKRDKRTTNDQKNKLISFEKRHFDM